MSILKMTLVTAAAAALLATAAGAQDYYGGGSAGDLNYEFGGIEPEATRLERASFEPIAKVAAAKRVVRRISWRDPFNSMYAPNITLEKMPSGEVTYTVTGNFGKISKTGKITTEQWKEILAAESAIAAAPKKQKVAVKELCHSNRMVIETSDANGKTRRRDTAICNGPGDTEALLYTYKVADIVVTQMDKCGNWSPQRDPWWSLQNCVSPRRRRGAD